MQPVTPPPGARSVRAARAWLGGPAALAVVLALGGCGGLGPVSLVPSATVPPEAAAAAASAAGSARTDASSLTHEADGPALDDVGAAELVERMAAVLADGSEDEWAAFFTGDDLVAQQRAWFRAVQDVPMDVRELRPDGKVEQEGEDAVVPLLFVHQVTGADPAPTAEGYLLTVAPDGLVTEVDGDRAHPQLWDLGAVSVTVTDQLVLLTPEDRQEDVDEVLQGLENAVANVFLDFGRGTRERLVVQLVDEDLLREIAGDDDLAVDPAGVALTLAPAEGEGRASAPDHADRILLDLDLLVEELDYGIPEGGWGLMRHEAVHAVLDADPQVTPPVWVWEGLAEWYGYRRDYLMDASFRLVVADAGDGLLELPESFDEYYYDSQEAGELAYASSAMVFSFLEQRFGFATARDVGVELSSVDTWQDTDEADALLRERTGMGLQDLQREMTAWARATYG
ncbi:hypothetical protein GCM10009584_04060 [Ornithinimicrobium humiphilum]|uniref:Peptidase MA superfamily protein n=1 Tax=Ornithinimicrobium humiphilum TaxID=125288 RepID=A0A543K7U2_9MICO|nr:hypothetical protein [Ornithinimicrobium humiphilum]TQM91137.1 hypothetical protein FB476_2863 [Ornithinimicrobium humiphilum]